MREIILIDSITKMDRRSDINPKETGIFIYNFGHIVKLPETNKLFSRLWNSDIINIVYYEGRGDSHQHSVEKCCLQYSV